MSFLPTPDNLWIFVATITGGTIAACLRIIGHAYHDAVRWHDLRVEVRWIRSAQERRIEKLARIEAGVNERPRRAKRPLPGNLREPTAVADEVAGPKRAAA